ncbi:MAG: phage integrase central domain-containing protein [Aestuariivirga sp.]
MLALLAALFLLAVSGARAESVAMPIRQWASAIFRHAVATLRADSDPAQALRGAIHRLKVMHHRPACPQRNSGLRNSTV